MKTTIDIRRLSISQTRLATTILSVLLLISVAAIPLALISVGAASPTITVSPTSGNGDLTDPTLYGAVDPYKGGTTVYITGTGFPAEQDEITFRIADTSTTISTTAGDQLYLNRMSIPGTQNIYSSTQWGQQPAYYTFGTSAKADASGSFRVAFVVPQLKAQQYNIWAVYTESGKAAATTSPVVFTVNAVMAIVEEQNAYQNAATGVFNSKVHILLSGFDKNEKVSLIPTNFLTTQAFGNVPLTEIQLAEDLTYEGGSTALLASKTANVGYITSRKGGPINVLVFGETSGITCSTTFNIMPSMAFTKGLIAGGQIMNSDPTLSINRTASTIYVQLRNWLDSVTIPASSLQLVASGVSYLTSHTSVTTSDDGAVDNLQVTYFNDLPTLPLSATLNGITFSMDAGNIIATDTLRMAEQSITPRIAAKKPTDLVVPLAGALVASDPARPDYVQLGTNSVLKHSAGDARSLVWVLAVNGVPGTPWGVDLDEAGKKVTLWGMNSTDSMGAGLAFMMMLPANPMAASGNLWARDYNTDKYDDHLLNATGAVKGIQTTLYIRPYVNPKDGDPTGVAAPLYDWTLGSRGYREKLTLNGYGFKAGESISVTVGGVSWFNVTPDVNGSFLLTPTGTSTDYFPKVAYGAYPAIFLGTKDGNTFSRTIKSRPEIIMDPTADAGFQEALTVNHVTSGNPVVLRSSATIGVFGLKASQAYVVSISGHNVGSFVSTSDGAIPGSISFIAPSLSSGLYYVDILDSTGASAIFPARYNGDQFRSRDPTYPTPNGLGGVSGTFNSRIGQGTGLQITISPQLQIFPASTYPTATVTISGGGLTPNTQYYVTLSNDKSKLSGPWQGFSLAQFLSTSAGTIPANVKLTLPDVPGRIEQGTTWYIHASDSDDLAALKSGGYGTISLQAVLLLSQTSGAVGVQINFTGHGFAANKIYPIYFNYVNKDNPGLVVGSLIGDDYGKATGYFNVPSLAPGSYNIQCYNTTTATWNILNIMPVFTITTGGGGGGPGPIGTGTFSPASPALLSSSGTTITTLPKNTGFFVQLPLTSNIGSALSVLVLTQIKDASGTIVSIGLTAADMGAGATKSVPVAFTGISSPGTYTATIFVWDGIKSPTPLAPTSVLVITVT